MFKWSCLNSYEYLYSIAPAIFAIVLIFLTNYLQKLYFSRALVDIRDKLPGQRNQDLFRVTYECASTFGGCIASILSGLFTILIIVLQWPSAIRNIGIILALFATGFTSYTTIIRLFRLKFDELTEFSAQKGKLRIFFEENILRVSEQNLNLHYSFTWAVFFTIILVGMNVFTILLITFGRVFHETCP